MSNANKEDPFSFLRNTHFWRIKKEMLTIIACVIKIFIYAPNIVYRITHQQAFHVFGNDNLWLQFFRQRYKIEEKRIKNLCRLPLSEFLFFTPILFTISGNG